MAVCLGTLLARAKRHVQPAAGHRRTDLDYGTQGIAYAVAQGQLAYYRLLAEQGEMTMIGTASETRRPLAQLAAGPDGPAADRQHPGHGGGRSDRRSRPGRSLVCRGLRSVMLSHYGQSHYSVGTGENGPLTPRGVEMLKEFERVGMILDVTHLSDQSFFRPSIVSRPGDGQPQQLPRAGAGATGSFPTSRSGCSSSAAP